MKYLNPFFLDRLDELLFVCPGLSCTSWGRSTRHNAASGGADLSQHLNWAAVDLVADSLDQLYDAARKAVVLNFPGIELDLRSEHLHLHLDWRAGFWRVVWTSDGFKKPLDEFLHSQGGTQHV